MSNSKVKGLLKGLRYISQIFENEKEPEMQIGNPTDVKHVAHIGCGRSVNSPVWMNEFKKPPLISSAPLCLPEPGDIKEDVSVKCLSEDCSQIGEKGSSSGTCNPPNVPKSSRRPSSIDSPTTRERSERHKARRSSKTKESSDKKQTTERPEDPNHSPTLSLPDIPRHGRRKKTSRSKAQGAETYKAPFSDPGYGSETGSISIISNNTGLSQTP